MNDFDKSIEFIKKFQKIRGTKVLRMRRYQSYIESMSMNWISIQDKFPPNKSNVLAAFKFRASGLNETQCIKLCYYDYTDGFNLKEEKCPYGTRIDHIVTHWMLRPEFPPLEDE